MITISSNETELTVAVEIPSSLAPGDRHYLFRLERLGDPIAVRALAQALQQALNDQISQIRLDAYNQGAKDRARKRKEAAGWLSRTEDGGCW
jgi:hypothetical protein